MAAGTPNDGSQTITLPPAVSSSEARIKVEAVDNVFFDISNKSFVINQAPVITCPASKTVETDPGQCAAALPFAATATDDQEGVSVACVPPSGSTFGRGFTAVTCTATDTYGATDSCSFSVTVVDAEAPSIAGLATTPSVLRPPDHKMVNVTVAYQATDNCDALPAVTCALSVTSNEPINGTGDGDKAPDWQILDAHRLRLREERAGGGTGRIYTIGVVCTDGAGNTTAPATTQVLVPLNTAL
ncbi:MAG: hypothetical protein DMF51_03000 [Acidobacteria bacterium]|nr:MAG: hypothetical protein DMF51_03000 [Acidobacteriota bacterium]